MGYEQLEDFSSRDLAKKGGAFLTAEEETALWQTWFESTDEIARQKARETILLKHMPLCKKTAEHWARKNRLSADDFFSEAYTEMTAAFDRYDPAKGARFSTFIELSLQGALRDAALASGQIKTSNGTKRSLYLFSNWGELNRQALKENPALSDYQRHKKIAELVRARNPEDYKHITPEEVAAFEARLKNRHTPLDRSIYADDEGGPALQDTLIASWGSATQRLEENDDFRIRQLLHRIVESPKLNDRERQVITQRHLVEDEDVRTLNDLAKEFGVSIERVRQIEEEGLRKVRQAMKWRPPARRACVSQELN